MSNIDTDYVIQDDNYGRCDKCDRPVYLLCREDGDIRKPWFYICFECQKVWQVGKGLVKREHTANSDANG